MNRSINISLKLCRHTPVAHTRTQLPDCMHAPCGPSGLRHFPHRPCAFSIYNIYVDGGKHTHTHAHTRAAHACKHKFSLISRLANCEYDMVEMASNIVVESYACMRRLYMCVLNPLCSHIIELLHFVLELALLTVRSGSLAGMGACVCLWNVLKVGKTVWCFCDTQKMPLEHTDVADQCVYIMLLL